MWKTAPESEEPEDAPNIIEVTVKEEQSIESELEDRKLLQDICTALVHEDDLSKLYEKIVNAASIIMHSDFASLQMFCPDHGASGLLRLLAFRGFSTAAADFWAWVDPVSKSVCGEALRLRERVVVSDVDACTFMEGSEDLSTCKATGIRAVQTTPLVARGGRLVGMISTQWSQPYEPSEREWSLFNILTSLAADVIERKQFEEALYSAKNHLERRVEERTAELNDALKLLKQECNEKLKAMEALREKDRLLIQQNRLAATGEMINCIAHQWRQPLNLLGLHVQQLLLVNDSSGYDREFLRRTVDSSMQLIMHMSRTIDDFRTFFSPNKEKERFTVNDAIKKAVSLVKDIYQKDRVTISLFLEAHGEVEGYFNEYSQALLNIIQNAKEALLSRDVRGACITITSRSENGRHIVTVEDNAGGISEDIICSVFDPYFTTKGRSGTGIGLYMTRNIIEMNMGGTVAVLNSTKGACFTVTL